MNRTALLRSAGWALLRNKLRSLLTVLGITIGIAAVVCVVAIGKAGQVRVEQQLNNLGDNFVWIEAGGRAVNGVRTGTHGTKTLTLADAAAIKAQIPLIKSVSPNVDGSVQIIYANQNWFTGYRGVSPEYFEIKRAGRYLLEGTDVSTLDKARLAAIRNRQIGFVFQGFNLLARTTALENTELPTLYAPIDKVERTKRAAEALAMVGLADRAAHYPSQMSGGQQQRVAIARALVNHPSILLADEPTGNLDSRTSVEIMQIFQDLNDRGLTIVLVTHEHDISQFAKRVIIFRDGRIRKDEPVVTRPRARDVLETLPTLDD
jgi:putative ABC transport system ATP-binding protein